MPCLLRPIRMHRQGGRIANHTSVVVKVREVIELRERNEYRKMTEKEEEEEDKQ